LLEYTDILKFLSSFVIVVVIIYSIYYGINRYWKGLLPNQKSIIKILDIKFIGKDKGLAVVKANNKYYFLAFSEKNISIIEKWDKLDGDTEKGDEKISDNTN